MKIMSDKLPVIRSETLTMFTGIEHGFFTRKGGVSNGVYASLNCGYGSNDKIENIKENRRRVCESMGVEMTHLVSVDQVHGNNVELVNKPWEKSLNPTADGMATNKKGIALSVLTADCAPVLFGDVKRGVIGACHAGWRGALGGIIESTILRMESLGSLRSDIIAAIGPCIGQKSYQVGIDLKDRFLNADPGYSVFFIKDDEKHFLFSLSDFVKFMTERSKIADCEIVQCDSYEETETFFSYRYSKIKNNDDFGRCISAIALRD